MSELIIRANTAAGNGDPLIRVTPDVAGWNYVGFEVYRLGAKDTVRFSADEKEVVVIILEGSCNIRVGNETFLGVGKRDSVFEPVPPEAVYSPPGCSITVSATTKSEIAFASAKTHEGSGGPRIIQAADIAYERRGDGVTSRSIHHILDEHHPANKLLLVEVITPPGNWSSFPPHKHDVDIPDTETYLEETYYFRINPPCGQVLQWVYDKQKCNTVLTPSDGDLVLVPSGYHPVASPPGFTTYYLNVMAGNKRVWKYTLDSDFNHVSPKGGNIMGNITQVR